MERSWLLDRLHEHHTAKKTPPEGNLVEGSAVFLLNARGNYIHSPGKFIAAIGVTDLVVVETPDALLITTRQHAQDVGKVVKYLDEKKVASNAGVREIADRSMTMAKEIKFGTDGWRGIIADDFTFDNVRRVAGAIASYVLKYEDARGGVFVGYDARFASPRAAQMVAEVIAAAGIP